MFHNHYIVSSTFATGIHHYLYLHYLWSPQGYLNVVVKVLCSNNNNITCESQLQCNTYFNIFFKEEVTV